MPPATPLDPATRAYLADSYPRNHNYRLCFSRLVPSWRLYRRYRKIRALYPAPLESLGDLSCNKGYFALHAAERLACPRVLGIDVSERDVEASRAARAALDQEHVRFEVATPSELAARLDEFGGPFQTTLLINVYHYLYLGSRSDPRHLDSHAAIFEVLRALTSDTLVFSNCTELEQLPRHLREMAREQGRAEDYTEAAIRAAAEPFFEIEPRGTLGKRPLWRLRAR